MPRQRNSPSSEVLIIEMVETDGQMVQKDWPLCLHPSTGPHKIPPCPQLRFLLSVTQAISLAFTSKHQGAGGVLSLPALLSSWPGAPSGSPEWDLHPRISVVQLIYLSKRICRAQFFYLTPMPHSLAPLCTHSILLPRKWQFFFTEGIKPKIRSQRQWWTFLIFFLPLFVMLAPSQFTVFYFLSSVCVNFYIIFFFLHSSGGKGFLSLNILPASAYFWMLFIKSQLFIHRNKAHSTNPLWHNSTCWLLSPGKVYWMYDREFFL